MNHDKQAKTFQHEQGELCPGVIRPKPVAPVPLGKASFGSGKAGELWLPAVTSACTHVLLQIPGTHTEIRHEVVERGR